jgi:hypothetical protein
MIEKLVGNTFVEVDGYQSLKAGDVFRTRDGAGDSPLMLAKGDPQLVDHPSTPGKRVWALRATPVTML